VRTPDNGEHKLRVLEEEEGKKKSEIDEVS
jgi:hypothetical protein